MISKLLKVLWIVSAVLCVLFFLLAGTGWWLSCRKTVRIPEITAVLTPAEGIAPGEDIAAAVQITLPWCWKIENIRTELPPGMVAAGKMQCVRSYPRLTGRTLTLKQILRPLRPGKTREGKILFDITRRGKGSLSAAASIPSFEVSAGTQADKLQLASAVDVSRHRSRYWIAAAAAVLIICGAVLLIIYLRRPRKARELTEWELAVEELAGLRRRIDARELPPEQAFIALTELIRRYLERRFGLPITRRTAQEFLGIMEKYGSTFPAESRPFLKAFLAEADLVKFAKAVPEENMVARSAESAGEFINRTRPESEVKNV